MTVVLRLSTTTPDVKVTGSVPPPICTICVAAPNGFTPAIVWTCSCSSNAVIASWPRGYHAGVVPHAKNPCGTLGSRQTINDALAGAGAGTRQEFAVPPG